LAARKGKRLGVKFSNTLVVVNHRTFFTDDTMYLSGAPLHVITLNLVERFRKAMGPDLPISFSAGIDQHNFAEAVAQGFVPVTTCTDLLRPGGYGRLPAYLTRLQQKMRAAGAHNINDYIIKAEGCGLSALDAELARIPLQFGDDWQQLNQEQRDDLHNWSQQLRNDCAAALSSSTVALASIFSRHCQYFDEQIGRRYATALQTKFRESLNQLYSATISRAGWLNTAAIVPRTTADARYHQDKNRAAPRKIGSKLWLYDCINCDKCIPVCPNNANFAYELPSMEIDCLIYRVTAAGIESLPGRALKIGKTHQIGNYADFCNECGNCDVFCPEDGGPYIIKPRFFGTLATMREHRDYDGCCFVRAAATDQVYGRFQGREYLLSVARDSQQSRFSDGQITLEFDAAGQAPRATAAAQAELGHTLDSYYYFVMHSLFVGVFAGGKINYLNIPAFADDAPAASNDDARG
jgi:putative selenate reductase